jgi:hypothetical protein
MDCSGEYTGATDLEYMYTGWTFGVFQTTNGRTISVGLSSGWYIFFDEVCLDYGSQTRLINDGREIYRQGRITEEDIKKGSRMVARVQGIDRNV